VTEVLLLIALVGFVVPNGYFLYWMFNEFNGIAPILSDHLAMGFILDCLIAVVLLAYWFATHPPGPVRWPWFVVLSFAGGLGFSLPLYWWLNDRARARRA
jgi:uncharacterized protein DUF2834